MQSRRRPQSPSDITYRDENVMSTAARKARKIAGIKFEKPAKVATPVAERSWFAIPIFNARTAEYRPRSAKKVARAMAARTV